MKYFTVPMARATDNQALLDPDYRPEPDSEPQMPVPIRQWRGIRRGALLRAPAQGGAVSTGSGFPGPWDRFYDDVWDLPRPDLSEDAGAAGQAGLGRAAVFSGQGRLETEGGVKLCGRGERPRDRGDHRRCWTASTSRR